VTAPLGDFLIGKNYIFSNNHSEPLHPLHSSSASGAAAYSSVKDGRPGKCRKGSAGEWR
jgi:hypothetical protein